MIKNKTTILVVDDEVDICNMVGDILKDEGYDIITANGYDDALNVIKNQNITLIITDIWMNNNTEAGLELLEWSKKNNFLTPLIMMSGHGNIETAMKAAKNGAFDFIEKPFDPDILLEKIKIAIDSNRKQIELLGRYRTLTKKECEIFECVAKGKKNKEMAENLCISMPTVEAHRSRVMKKMQASSLSELVKMSVTLSK